MEIQQPTENKNTPYTPYNIGVLLLAVGLVVAFVALMFYRQERLERPAPSTPSAIWIASNRVFLEVQAKGIEEQYRIIRGGSLSPSDNETDAVYFNFLAQAKNNEALKQALMYAKKENISIVADTNFRIGTGVVWINAKAPVQEIIKFLTGD